MLVITALDSGFVSPKRGFQRCPPKQNKQGGAGCARQNLSFMHTLAHELHFAFRHVALGKVPGEDKICTLLLKFGLPQFWECMVKVCREQYLLFD